MRRMLAILCLLLPAMVLVGCDSATSVHPVGAVPVGDLAPRIDGGWVVADEEQTRSLIHLRYLGDGELVAAGIKWDDEAEVFTLETYRGRLLEDDGVLFINFRPIDLKPNEPRAAGDEHYTFVRLLVQDNGSLQVAGPNVAAFAAAVEDGSLDGTVERKNNLTEVVITSEAQALNTFIDPAKAEQQFDLDNATVLKRVVQPQR